jgi:hypothetical protein
MDLLRRRPRSTGENAARLRRVLRSESRDRRDSSDAELTERRLLLRAWLTSRFGGCSSYWEVMRSSGGGDGERESEVEIVETEVEECEDMDRVLRGLFEASMELLRPRSASLRASCSSATPFLVFN